MSNMEGGPKDSMKCKYCGKEFIKKHNRQMYCSKECKCKSTQDNKAKYQRKRRKLINKGELISNETQKLGTVYFPNEIGNWDKERQYIKRAQRSVGLQ